MGRYAHHSTVTVAHQHVVTNPKGNLQTRNRVCDGEPGIESFLFACGEFGLGGATLFALLDECSQRRIGLRSMGCKRVFRCDSTECHAHDGIGARRKDKHFAVLDQLTRSIFDGVGKSKAQPLTLADPVFLHRAHTVGPAI